MSGSEDDRDLPGFVVPNEEVDQGSLLDVDEPDAEMSDSSSSSSEQNVVPTPSKRKNSKKKASPPKLSKTKSVATLDDLLGRVKQIASIEYENFTIPPNNFNEHH